MANDRNEYTNQSFGVPQMKPATYEESSPEDQADALAAMVDFDAREKGIRKPENS